MFITCANLNEPLLLCPDLPVVPKLEGNCFNYPKSVEAVGIYPNVSNCMEIAIKQLNITQIGMKLFEVAQN